ncbi:formimidoylglutamate deiminase, partial [Rhizorhabdus histidinilytica]
ALGAPAGLAVGHPADFVTLDADHPALAERDAGLLTDGWLFAAGRQAVDGVWRRGRRLVTAGRHADRARIAARYRRVLGEVLA